MRVIFQLQHSDNVLFHTECVIVLKPHFLSAAVGGDRPLRGSSQCRPVVVEVAGRIHLVLWRGNKRKQFEYKKLKKVTSII